MPSMLAHCEVGAHSQHDVIAAGDVKQLVTLLHKLVYPLLDIHVVQTRVILRCYRGFRLGIRDTGAEPTPWSSDCLQYRAEGLCMTGWTDSMKYAL